MQCKMKIALFSRAFLAAELSPLLANNTDIELICFVTSKKEFEIIKSFSLKIKIIHIKDYFDDLQVSELDKDLEGKLAIFLNTCRFFRNTQRDKSLRLARSWFRQFELAIKTHEITAIIDEPLSTTINYCLQLAADRQSLKVFHFHSCWVPDFTFFSFDQHQNNLADGIASDIITFQDLVNHSRLRLSGANSPIYVRGVNKIGSKVLRLTQALASIGSRMLFKKDSFTDQNIDYLLYDVKCILSSVFKRSHYCQDLENNYCNILFPLHYYPEAVLQTWSAYTRQVEIVENILDVLPANCRLIIKEHPQQVGATGLSEFSNIRKNKNVLIVRGDISAMSLVQNVNCVVTIGSTLAIDFAMMGIPAAILGKPHYLSAPMITGFNKLDDSFSNWLHDQTTKKMKPLEVNINFINWYHKFMNEHAIPGTIIPGNTKIDARKMFKLIEENL